VKGDEMGLDLWFREDVVRILASVQETLSASVEATRLGEAETVQGRQIEVAEAYQQGFADALRVVGIAFGVAGVEGREPGWAGGMMRLLGGEGTAGYRRRNGGGW
jgi:hypothetical protein